MLIPWISALLLPLVVGQVPCNQVDPLLTLPCICIQLQEIYINCDNVAFPNDFPLLPFQMNITEYQQKHAGIQSLTGQLFTNSDLPLRKVDFSLNMIRSVSKGVWDGLENVLEDLSLRHNLLGETYNVLAGAYNTQQASTEISKLVALEKLDLGHNSIRKLDDGLFSQMGNLKILRLDGNSFDKVPTNVFNGLTGVKLITLHDNDIDTIPLEAYITTPSLRALDMSNNRISFIEEGAFLGLLNLTQIDLSWNKLTELLPGALQDLGNVRELDLSGNFLTELPSEALKEVKNIQTLKLQNNNIQDLGGVVALGPLNTLEELSLARNNIRKLNRGTFTQLMGLIKLDLSVNSIRNLEADAFEGLLSLETLHLDDNNILSISEAALEKIPTLKVLTLDYNRIKVISNENLKFVTKLEKLSLAHNIIQDIPIKTFAEFTKLRHLNLKGNKVYNIQNENLAELKNSLEDLNLGLNVIEELPVFDFPNLIKLDLSKNNIGSLPLDAFLLLPALESLDLHGNKLSSLPPTVLYPLNRLATIDLSQNNIYKIHNGQFKDSLINVINLQNNEITEIPEQAFENLPYIHTIDLSSNQISIINNNGFYNTPFLHILRLNKNKITSFKKEFFNLTKSNGTELRILDLSKNDITFLNVDALDVHPDITWASFAHNRLSFLPPDFLRKAKTLKHLDISYNMIEKLEPEYFANSTYLRELILKNNIISDIDETAFQYSTQLQELDLSHNRIRSLPEMVFRGIARLSIDLSHNELSDFPLDIFNRKRLQKMQAINLSYNKFTTVPAQALKKQSLYLTDLNLSHNQIKNIPNNADSLINAKTLDLSFNPLTPNDIHIILNEPKVTGRINLSGTGIKEIPVIESPFLLSLNLSHNNIYELKEGSFNKTKHIRELDVSHNNIPNLSYGLATAWPKIPFLKYLDVSYNPIQYIVNGDLKYLNNLEVLKASNLPRVVRVETAALSSLNALKELHLHSLPEIGNLETREILQEVPGLEIVDIEVTEEIIHDHLHPAFSPRLKSLTARGKSLQALSGGAFAGINSPELEIGLVNTSISQLKNKIFLPVSMSSIITLNVDQSEITTLDKSFLNSLKTTQKHIHLTGLDTNPLFCDCNAKSLQEWVISLGESDSIRNITCSAPQNLIGIKLTDIDSSQLTCVGRPSTTTTDLPLFTTTYRKNFATDQDIITSESEEENAKSSEKDGRASKAGALTNMDALIIGVVGGVVAFVFILISIICIFKARSGSSYKGGPMAAPCTCVKPPIPPPSWGPYPAPGSYPTLPHAHTRGNMKMMPPSTPVPPAYGTVSAHSAHSARSYYSGPPYFMGYPQDQEMDHR